MIVERKNVFKIEIPVKSNDYDGANIYHIFHVYNNIYAVIHHVKYCPKGYNECIECAHSAKFFHTKRSLVKFLKRIGVPDEVVNEVVK